MKINNTTTATSVVTAAVSNNSTFDQSMQNPWDFLTMSQSASELIGNMVLLCTAVFIMFGGIIPFVFQYQEIKKRQSASGFSLYVCLTLFIANILRIMFWFGKRFELTLLLQSIFMIMAMCAMVHLVVTTNRKHLLPPYKPISAFDGHLVTYFWEWTDLSSYAFVVLSFTVLVGFITSLLLDNIYYVELIGFVSLFIEANLGSSQCYKNFVRKSTTGMSVTMVFLWMVGDIGKTSYFFVRAAPIQFGICGLIQITIDVLIMTQVYMYRKNKSTDF